jgi:hypothetical protein
MAKDKGGRPPKCSVTLGKEVAAYVMGGAEPKVAALSVGIPETSWRRWMSTGAEHNALSKRSVYAAFWREVESAKAKSVAAIDMIVYRDAMKGSLAHAQTFYRRRSVEGFEDGRRVQVSAEVTGKDGGPIQSEAVGVVHLVLPANGRELDSPLGEDT